MVNSKEKIQNTKANLDASGVDWRTKAFSHPERTIRLATSFSGIGAIEQALKRLGLNTDIQFAGDIDPDCKKSYFANYDISEENWHTDIAQFDARPFLGKVDLLVGGAPCQAFSMRGKRGGFDDTRGTLFREFARVIIECQPKIFIFENVKGILSHDKGRTWKTIKETFENDCGYQVYYQVLNGRDYGVAQSRERLYCIGFKKETDFTYPAPIPLQKAIRDYLLDSFDRKYLLKQKGVHFITRTINHQKSYTQINGDVTICQKRNQQFNWHGDFVFHPLLGDPIKGLEENLFTVRDFEEDYFTAKSDSSFAITGICGDELSMNPDKDQKCDTSRGYYRKLAPRECLRLMGFDDSFKIVVPDTALYKQSGNSIIVDVLMAILRQLDITKYAE